MRARFALAASIAAAAMLGVELIAQTTAPPAPDAAADELRPRREEAHAADPRRGGARMGRAQARTRKGDMVITQMTVRNASAAPIARLQIDETWYDKTGATVTAGRGVINGLLQPGETTVVEIETPWKAGMSGFQRQFTHANGTIKPVKVNKLDAPKPTTDSATHDDARSRPRRPRSQRPPRRPIRRRSRSGFRARFSNFTSPSAFGSATSWNGDVITCAAIASAPGFVSRYCTTSAPACGRGSHDLERQSQPTAGSRETPPPPPRGRSRPPARAAPAHAASRARSTPPRSARQPAAPRRCCSAPRDRASAWPLLRCATLRTLCDLVHPPHPVNLAPPVAAP